MEMGCSKISFSFEGASNGVNPWQREAGNTIHQAELRGTESLLRNGIGEVKLPTFN